jgi:putative nucleotidyltransferase with HDIG domain
MAMINDPDKIFEDITQHLLADEKPSLYIEELDKQSFFREYPFIVLHQLKATEQSPKFHPEGSAWNHTMMVLDEAANVRTRSSNPKVLLWSALLHDIGKPSTTRNRKGKITSYDHDKIGESLCIEFLQYFNQEASFIEAVSAMVRYHMHMLYVLKKLPYADVKGLIRRTDAEELALLCLCDRLGRTGADRSEEENEYREFLQLLRKLT